MDPESSEWLRVLESSGAEQADGQRRLHALLLRVAHRELNRRGCRIEGPEREDVAHQVAGDAMLAILARIPEFRGESRFTTWAYAFVMFETSAKLARHWSRNAPAPLAEEEWERLPDRLGLDPAEAATSADLLTAVRRAVGAELTDHQRGVFVALVLDGEPLDALAQRLGSSRGAVYKTMFDARRKIRAFLVTNGYLDRNTPTGRHA